MVDLLIFGGQSNMQGQTESDPSDKPVEGAKEFKLLSKTFVPLKNPVGEDIGELLGARLARSVFCRKLSQKNGKGRYLRSRCEGSDYDFPMA